MASLVLPPSSLLVNVYSDSSLFRHLIVHISVYQFSTSDQISVA